MGRNSMSQWERKYTDTPVKENLFAGYSSFGFLLLSVLTTISTFLFFFYLVIP